MEEILLERVIEISSKIQKKKRTLKKEKERKRIREADWLFWYPNQLPIKEPLKMSDLEDNNVYHQASLLNVCERIGNLVSPNLELTERN